LAYLWSFVYFTVIFDEEGHQQFPTNRKHEVHIIEQKGNARLERAAALLCWAISLKKRYSDWPQEYPKPTDKLESDDYIEMANRLFIDAAVFIMLHEVGHAVGKHYPSSLAVRRKKKLSKGDIASTIRMEYEADQFAIDQMIHRFRAGCKTS